ncbi:hypothetical protein Hdeb2414_s0008g00293601 [Helianthus debilis subsp. tardiflorus]
MIDLKTFELSVFDPESGTEMVFKKDDVVKGKSKIDDAQTQRNLRSRVKTVDAAPITGSPVLKSTNLWLSVNKVSGINGFGFKWFGDNIGAICLVII